MSDDLRIDGRTREGRAMRGLADAPTVDEVPEGYEGKVTRSTRQPFGASVQKLAFPPRPGFHRHWFNDVPGRVEAAQKAGYMHVKDPVTGQNVRRVVGKTEQGAGLDGYLMEIPKEWWDADMAENAKRADEKEESIRRGQVDAGADRDKFRPMAQGRKIDIRSSTARR